MIFHIHRTVITTCFSFLFIVTRAVRFTSIPPPSMQVPENGEASFPCTIDTFQENIYTFKWFRINKETNVSKEILESERFVITENDRLKITAAQTNDEHYKYQCNVYQGENLILTGSTSEIIVLRMPKKEFPKCSKIQEIKIGDEVSLECQSEKTNAELQLSMEWNNSFDVNTQLETLKHKIIIKHSFIASKNDNGAIITCKLKSEVLGTETRRCSLGPLIVKYPPIVKIQGESILEINMEKVYVCSADGNPDVETYRWTTNLKQSEYNIENEGRAFRVKPLKRLGFIIELTCLATNNVGETRESMKITIVRGQSNFYLTKIPFYSSEPLNTMQNKPQTATSYTTILSVTGAFLLLLASMMTLLLCIFLLYSRRHQSLDYTGQRVPQPDVYFEPKDSVATMRRTVEGKWKRSIGAQVPMDLDKDSISLYAEIEEGKKT